MSTPRPDWADTGYDGILASFGHPFVSEYFGDYQGDIAAVFTDGGRVGWLVVGYGSCSGCDELEAIRPWCSHGDGKTCGCDWQGVIDLRDRLLSEITWDASPPEEDPNRWWTFERDINPWLRAEFDKAIAAVTS